MLIALKKSVDLIYTILFMAEEKGFEPLHPVTGLRAFQARPFSRLGIPPIKPFLIIAKLGLFINIKSLK